MPAPKQTKKQRIEEAREAARLAREKREKRQKLLKVLVPALVTVGVLAIVAIVVVVIAIQPKPAAALPGGPKNMASDGIVYVQKGSKASYVATAALKKGQKPASPDLDGSDAKVHVVTYVDLSCPGCQKFEATYADQLKQMVAAGDITLEIKPVAILDHNYTTNYSTRAGNVASCVANYQPAKFLDAIGTLYENQATEGSAGLTNDKMISLIRAAGVTEDRVDACIRGTSYKKWITAATQRFTSQDSLVQPGQQGVSTPTVTINGKLWDGSDLNTAIQQAAQS